MRLLRWWQVVLWVLGLPARGLEGECGPGRAGPAGRPGGRCGTAEAEPVRSRRGGEPAQAPQQARQEAALGASRGVLPGRVSAYRHHRNEPWLLLCSHRTPPAPSDARRPRSAVPSSSPRSQLPLVAPCHRLGVRRLRGDGPFTHSHLLVKIRAWSLPDSRVRAGVCRPGPPLKVTTLAQ